MRTRVKVCGIKTQKDLSMVVEAGVDAVGFVVDVPSSPRSLTVKEARRLVRLTPVFVETVAVTVPKDPSHLERIVEEVNPDAVQIHGLSIFEERLESVLSSVKIIAAVPATENAPEVALRVSNFSDAILVDTPGGNGGTGRTHDWTISRRVRELIHPKPLILAGGLNPWNVGEAVKTVKPYAVDVSSGVEVKPGVKDRDKVFKFVKSVLEVEA